MYKILRKICCTTFRNEMSCWVLNIKCRKFVWFKEVLITLHMVSKHQTFYRIRNYNGFQIIGCLIDNQYYDLNAKNINQDYTSKLYCCGYVSWAFRHRKYWITIVLTILSIENRKFIYSQIGLSKKITKFSLLNIMAHRSFLNWECTYIQIGFMSFDFLYSLYAIDLWKKEFHVWCNTCREIQF